MVINDKPCTVLVFTLTLIISPNRSFSVGRVSLRTWLASTKKNIISMISSLNNHICF